MMKIYVANVVTDSGNPYAYTHSIEPTKEQIITYSTKGINYEPEN